MDLEVALALWTYYRITPDCREKASMQVGHRNYNRWKGWNAAHRTLTNVLVQDGILRTHTNASCSNLQRFAKLASLLVVLDDHLEVEGDSWLPWSHPRPLASVWTAKGQGFKAYYYKWLQLFAETP